MAKAGGAFTVSPRLQVQSSGATVPQKLADNLVRSELHELKKGSPLWIFAQSHVESQPAQPACHHFLASSC